MTNEDFNDLITRLRNSSTPVTLREEVIMVMKQQRHLLEDIYMAAGRGSITTPEYLAGTALGKVGYGSPGDMGF
jgi:hypothetical protein